MHIDNSNTIDSIKRQVEALGKVKDSTYDSTWETYTKSEPCCGCCKCHCHRPQQYFPPPNWLPSYPWYQPNPLYVVNDTQQPKARFPEILCQSE